MNIEKRETRLDVIRITACFLVCSVHFFLNSYYYYYPLDNTALLFYTVIRSGCMICVPLFLVLTGYLMNKKKLSLKYYWGLEKTLLTYVLAGGLCMLFKKFVIKQEAPFSQLLNFTSSPYGWYVEMYIGLFLLIPFLNLIWNGLTGKRQRQVLVVTLIVLTALPSVVNIFHFENPMWWVRPSLSTEYMKIVPSWWVGIYPLTYYFLGAYMKEYPIRVPKLPLFTIILVFTTLYGLFCFFRSDSGIFVWGEWQNWEALPILVLTFLVFTFLDSFNMNKLPKPIRKFLALISDLCFGTYLLSWIADYVLYPILNEKQPYINLRIKYFFLLPIIVFFSATLLSAAVYLTEKLIHKALPLEKLLFKKKTDPTVKE